MQIHGVHHVTAVTGDVSANRDFYTRVLGLRLVKKTVNQDDVSAYHLFYADKLGTPGCDMTFFDWPQMPPNQRGTDSISNTMFRVNGRAALEYWQARFEAEQVKHEEIETLAGCAALRFEDPEGQRLTLVDDEGAPFEGEPWDGAGIPVEYAIRGIYGVAIAVREFKKIEPVLRQLLGFKRNKQYRIPGHRDESLIVFTLGEGGPGKVIHIIEQPLVAAAQLGRGGVHHVAFRVSDEDEQRKWNARLQKLGIGTSGIIDRFYFKSLYFRIARDILFELATDGPGFATDEPLETLGERLSLPPFLEPQREQIEAGLRPI